MGFAHIRDKLQWGRDLVIAEMFACMPDIAAMTDGFNGAAIW